MYAGRPVPLAVRSVAGAAAAGPGTGSWCRRHRCRRSSVAAASRRVRVRSGSPARRGPAGGRRRHRPTSAAGDGCSAPRFRC
ncbi:hypothetical protein G6F63_016224 [Rhizopus arrhizus]|nr:hypothetical protein G6F31_017618 [Rhizopus arrhizus]KAG1060674.1 hypothetical protein G6F40_018053 [Rhizopus arrhizus]KAG1313195.1 hypothetical protein G6F63_016224 [Rhizopus arrhizus]